MNQMLNLTRLLAGRGRRLDITLESHGYMGAETEVIRSPRKRATLHQHDHNTAQRTVDALLRYYPKPYQIEGTTRNPGRYGQLEALVREQWWDGREMRQRVINPRAPGGIEDFDTVVNGVILTERTALSETVTILAAEEQDDPKRLRVRRYVIEPVAELTAKELEHVLSDLWGGNETTDWPDDIRAAVAERATKMVERTKERLGLPEPTRECVWYQAIRNDQAEMDGREPDARPIVPQGRIALPSIMDSQAEMISALASLERARTDLVACNGKMACGPNHRFTDQLVTLEFRDTTGRTQPTLLVLDHLNGNKVMHTIAAEIYAGGKYPDAPDVRLAPWHTMGREEIIDTLVRCYERDALATTDNDIGRVRAGAELRRRMEAITDRLMRREQRTAV